MTVTLDDGPTYHVALDIDADWKRWGRGIRANGQIVTAYEFETLRAEYKARGFTCFPPCDDVNERGSCKGHRP